MNRQIPLEKGEKKLINAWAFYDWANSVYPLVISSTIFPIYFTALSSETKTIAFLGFDFKNTALISFVTAMAFIIVAFNSPLLSGIADSVILFRSELTPDRAIHKALLEIPLRAPPE